MAASKLHALWNHPAGPKTRFILEKSSLLLVVTRTTDNSSLSVIKDSVGGDLLEYDGPFQNLKTLVHFWAPTSKWIISVANFADFSKPPEKISYPQQTAITCTGLIWSRYSMVIIPKNWNLFSVNVAMAATGLYQLTRKIKQVGVQPETFL